MSDPIVIAGAGFRLPGDIADEAALWDALMGRTASPLGPPPSDRWPGGAPELDALRDGSNSNFHGGWLTNGCMAWEPERFGITQREAPHIRPNTRLVLECASDALEDAGLTVAQMEGSATAVVVGAKPEDHWDKLVAATSAAGPSHYDRFYISGAAHSTTSARVAHWLGTTGPISTVDSACASGSMALHQARLMIGNGDCELAIVGGVTTHLWPGPLLALSEAQMRSPRSEGGCLVLSQEADGYVPSEGCVCFVLAKQTTAQRLGLRTRLEVLSSKVGHNGRNNNGIVAPSCRAQEQLLSAILGERRLNEVHLLELHGTGTRVGDATEVNTVLKHLAATHAPAENLRLGSSKAIFGHTEEASGLVGILKVLVSLEKGVIPPFAVPSQISEKLDAIRVRPLLNRQAEELPPCEDGHVALVNSFGAFGAITSVMVRKPKQSPRSKAAAPAFHPPFFLSASNEEALNTMQVALKRRMEGVTPADGAQLAHALALRRTHHRHRSAILQSGQEESAPFESSPDLTFVFSGQGFAYSAPLRRLILQHARARQHLTALLQELDDLDARHGLNLSLITSENNSASLNEVQTQLLTVLFHLCLSACLQDWGITSRVRYAIGHSLGSLAATHFAGHLSLRDTLRLAAARAEAISQAPHGRMLAIKADRATVEDLLLSTGSESSFSNYNAPGSQVVSGPDVEQLQGAAKAAGLTCRFLDTAHSYHSSSMSSAAAQLRSTLAAQSWPVDAAPNSDSGVTMLSDMTGKPESAYTSRSIDYWADHLVSPVLFEDAVQGMNSDRKDVLVIEIGPSDGMSKLIQQQSKHAAVSCFRNDGTPAVDMVLAKLFCAGVEEVHWAAVWEEYGGPREAVATPRTPFNRRAMWPKVTARSVGVAQPVEGKETSVTTTSNAEMANILGQHRIHGQIVVPIALMITIITSSALDLAQGHNVAALELRDIEFLRPARLSNAQAKEAAFVTTFSKRPQGTSSFTLSLQKTATTRLELCKGTIALSSSTLTNGTRAEVATPASSEKALYDNAAVRATGLDYGPAFQLVQSLSSSSGDVHFSTRASTAQRPTPSPLDPCQLDAALHSVLLAQGSGEGLGLPQRIRQLTLSMSEADWSGGVQGRVAHQKDWDVVARSSGATLMSIRGLRFSGGASSSSSESSSIKTSDPRPQAQPQPDTSAMTFASIPEWHANSMQSLSKAPLVSSTDKVVVATDSEEKAQALSKVLGSSVVVAPTHDVDRALAILQQASSEAKGLTLIYWSSATPEQKGLLLDKAASSVMLPLRLLQSLASTPTLKWQALICHSPSSSGPPTSSLLAGLVPAFSAENRQTRDRVASIEVPSTAEPGTVADLVAQTMRLRQSGILASHTAYRPVVPGGKLQRYTLRHTPVVVPQPQPSSARPQEKTTTRGGSWLITGGTGDVCLGLLPWLARRFTPDRFIIVGRRDFSDVQDRLLQLHSTSAVPVRYQRLLDPSSPQEVTDLFQRSQAAGPVVGILHAAGALYPSLFKQLKEEELRESLVSKAALAWNLHTSCPSTVKHFWMMSSFAALVGMPGLASYTLSNQFIDALSHHRHSLSLPALSIQLGGWAGSDMAERCHEIMRLPHPDMQPEQACRLLEEAIERQEGPVVTVASLNVDTDAGKMFARDPAFHGLVEHLREKKKKAGPASVPTPGATAAPLPKALPTPPAPPSPSPVPIDVPSAPQPVLSPAAPPVAAAPTPAPPTSSPPPQATASAKDPDADDVSTRLRNLVAHILRLDDPSTLDAKQPLAEYGWDSLYHTEFRGLVKAQLGKVVPDDLAQHEITLQRVAQAVTATG